MAKARPNNQLLGIRTGGIGPKTKLIALLSVATLLWWIISNPVGAADKVTTVANALRTFFGSIGD